MKKTEIKKSLEQIAARYHLEAIYAFGSRSHEIRALKDDKPVTASLPRSDVDIGVTPMEGSYLSAREKARLAADLEDLFEVTRVDVVILPEAGPFLALDVIRGELLYSADADKQAEYELYVLRRAGDLAYYERQKRQTELSPEK